MPQSRAEAEQSVRDQGYSHAFTWTDRPGAHYPPHTHSGKTTHVVLSGGLTYSYPDDKNPKKETAGPGAVWDVDANRKHEVWVGPEGCTYVIGE